MEEGQYAPSPSGTPQGGILSPVLANMALDGMFDLLKNHNLLKGKKVNLIRYADDFVITGNDKTLLEQIVQPLMANFLQERGLRLSPA